MNILILTHEAYGGYGGIALYNRDLVDAFSQSTYCKKLTLIPLHYQSSDESIPDTISHVTTINNKKFNLLLQLLKTGFNGQQIDVIVCGHINLLPFAWFLKRFKKNAKLLLLIYGIDVWQPPKKFFIRYFLNRVDGVISISQITYERYQHWSKTSNPFWILPNAIHLEKYGVGEKSEHLIKQHHLQNKKVMLSLGRLDARERYKGIDEVIEALPQLLTVNPNLVYMIVGDGTDRERLQQKAVDLNLRDYVIFAGKIGEKEKADYYRLADVFVMPSRGEGFGFVYLEAMACGIPVIASKIDGGREALQNGSLGMLVHPDHSNEIVFALNKLLLEGNRAIPGGLDYFSFTNFSHRLDKILLELT